MLLRSIAVRIIILRRWWLVPVHAMLVHETLLKLLNLLLQELDGLSLVLNDPH